ncbi:MAG: hypothetical protein B9S26_09345 [Opitutia bacterium Tous-C4FEB]|nr:MAG: hypothetical protein B9S35_14575 [Opitutae bacterium Tous-C5TDCM]PAW89034.1 MAG: hypothetical protein B9S26_09345 [Opitutae bacterium Tous-C4FEB]
MPAISTAAGPSLLSFVHARQFLKPGGALAAVFLNSTSRISALQPFCQTWVELPRSTFAAEGTHFSTALLTMTG